MKTSADFDTAADTALTPATIETQVPADDTRNTFDEAAAQVSSDAHTQLRATMSDAVKQNPDEYAKAKKVAGETGVPADVVVRNPEVADYAAVRKYDQLFTTNPKLATALQNPELAKVAHDDIPALAGIERAKQSSDFPDTSNDEYVLGLPYNALQGLGLSYNKLSTALGISLGGLLVQSGAPKEVTDWWFKHTVDPWLAQRGALETSPGAPLADKALHTAGDLVGMLSQIILTGPGEAAPIAAEATAGAVVKGAAEHGTKAMLVPALTEAIDTGRKVYAATGDPNAALKAAQAAYLTTTLGGVMPLSVPGGIAKRLASGALSGAVTGEVSRQGMNLALPPEMQSPFEWEGTALSALAGSVLAIGGPRGEPRGAYDLIRKTYVDAAQADRAEKSAAALDMVNKFSAEAATRERDPEAFKQYVNDVTDSADVYIHSTELAKALQQSGVTHDMLAEKLPEVAAQLSEALHTQGDIRIPVAEYATYIAGGPADAAIRPFLKDSPNGMTLPELKEYYQTRTEGMQKQAEQILKDHQADTEFTQSAARVEKELLDQLNQANRFSAEVNAIKAKFAAALYTVKANQLGVTPEQMYAGMPLRVNASPLVGGERAMDQGTVASRLKRAWDAMTPQEGALAPKGSEGLGAQIVRGAKAFLAEPPAPQAFRRIPSVQDIHQLAEDRGIPFDNDKSFMDFTERVTGSRHLDELTPRQRYELFNALNQDRVLFQGAGEREITKFSLGPFEVKNGDQWFDYAPKDDTPIEHAKAVIIENLLINEGALRDAHAEGKLKEYILSEIDSKIAQYYLEDHQAGIDGMKELAARLEQPDAIKFELEPLPPAVIPKENQSAELYSEMNRQIEAAKMNVAPPAQWKAFIEGLGSKGVKKDEITMSGISEWLDLQDARAKGEHWNLVADDGVLVSSGDAETKARWERMAETGNLGEGQKIVKDTTASRISKEDILAYLGENGVRVEVKALGVPGEEPKSSDDYEPSDQEVEDRAQELFDDDSDSRWENAVDNAREYVDEMESSVDLVTPTHRLTQVKPDLFGKGGWLLQELDYDNRRSRNADDVADLDPDVTDEATYATEEEARAAAGAHAEFDDPYFSAMFDGDEEGQHDTRDDAESDIQRARDRRYEDVAQSDFDNQEIDDYYYERAREDLTENPPEDREPATDLQHAGSWQSNGGRDYDEIVVGVPDIAPYNKNDETHFGHVFDGRTVGWIRAKIHADANGVDTLWIEEYQSQRAQHGREQGFKGDKSNAETIRRLQQAIEKADRELEARRVELGNMTEADYLNDSLVRAITGERDELMSRHRAVFREEGMVPPGPFVQDTQAWLGLLTKQALRYAVDRGITQIAWTTGAENAVRYGTKSQIDSLKWRKDEQGIHIEAIKDGKVVVDKKLDDRIELGRHIGNRVAESIVNNPEQAGEINAAELDQVNGLGMQTFYGDSNGLDLKGKPSLVSIAADKVLKIIGDGRYDRVRQLDITVTEKGETFKGAPGFVITPEMAAKIKKGMPLFQGDPAQPRGQISFGPDLSKGSTLSLLAHADLSTFFHELGHFYLEMVSELASQPNAHVQVQADMQKILDWFGVHNLDMWRSMPLAEQRKYHEQFARGFEAYLMEGKAPSPELTSAFARVRAWMISIYKHLQNLNVTLTPEVRGVFDRMIATDEQIDAAEKARGMFAMFKEKPEGLTDLQWKDYVEGNAQATQSAVSEVQAKSIRDMQWLSNAKSGAMKALQKKADTERAAIRSEVTAEVDNQDIYKAERWLRKGETTDPATGDVVKAERGFKLDNAKLEEMYPATMNARPDLEKLRGMKGPNGMDPELAAEMFGFKSGDDLVRSLMDMQPKDDVIAGMTDQRMLERHGEMSDPQSIERAAESAIHNTVRARMIATELKGVAKGVGPIRLLLKGATEAADSAIAQRKVRDLNPKQHEAAEARASKAADKALGKADTEATILAKRAQLLNNRLAKAAEDALAEVKKGVDYQAKFDKPTTRENIDVAFRDQIDALRARFDFRKSLSPEQAKAARENTLDKFVEKLSAMKFDINVPESLLNEANRQHYKDMTVEEFRGVIDTIKALEHLGRAVQKVTDGTQQRLLNDVAQEAVAQAATLKQTKQDTNRGLGIISKKWIAAKSFGRSVHASLLKMEQFVDWLDSWNSNGVFNRMTFRKIADAENRRNDLDLKITKQWQDAINAMPKGLFKENRAVLEIPGAIDGITGETQRVSWHEKMMLAMIRGDASHFAKLLKGEKWETSAVLDFLDKNVSKPEWDFLHALSKTFGELLPLKSAMMVDLGSTAPKPVAHIPFTTPHGKYPGWYVPITYDPARSHSVAQRNAKHEASLFEDNIFTRADTSTGRENTRNENYAKPMLLSLDALPRVLKDEIRDITTRKAIIEADRFVSHPEVRLAITSAMSKEHYNLFNSWLLSLANDAAVKPNELQMWDRIAHEIRTRTTMVGLGLRLSTMVQHGLTAAGESVSEAGPMNMIKGTFNAKTLAALTTLGPEWMEKGIASVIRSDQFEANRDFIFERSADMRHRSNEFERDVREQLRDIQIKLADPATGALMRAKLAIQAHAYSGIAMLDMASALPTWMGGYLKAISPEAKGGLGMSEENAVYFADKTVRNAHGGAGIKDMAAIQRGGEWMKMFTMFYTFWNHNVNRILDTAKRAGTLPATIASGNMSKARGDIAMIMMRTMMYTLGVQAIHSMLHPPKKEDDTEGWLMWFGKQMGLAAFSGIPIARDVAGHYLGGRDYEASPIKSIVDAADANLKDVEGKAKTEQYIKHSLTTAGYITGLPLGQPASTVQFLADVWNGKQNPRDMSEWWQGIQHGQIHR